MAWSLKALLSRTAGEAVGGTLAATLGLPAVVILLLATTALVVEGRRLRHRGVTRMLRIN